MFCELLWKKVIKTMWKIKCMDLFKSTAFSVLKRRLGGRAKKIHKRPSTNHKLIYICQPITKSYYEL